MCVYVGEWFPKCVFSNVCGCFQSPLFKSMNFNTQIGGMMILFYILGRGGYVGVTTLTCFSNKLRSLYVCNKIFCISLLLSRTKIDTTSLYWSHAILAQWTPLAQWTSLVQCFVAMVNIGTVVIIGRVLWWRWSTLIQWITLAQCFGGHGQHWHSGYHWQSVMVAVINIDTVVIIGTVFW